MASNPEVAQLTQQSESLFQKMLSGQMAARFLLKSEALRVASVIDIFPARHARGAQAVIFPFEAVRVRKWDMPTRLAVSGVVQAIGDRIAERYNSELEVEHVEGYGVQNHGHVVLFPSFARGESAALHDPARLKTPADNDLLDQVAGQLRFSDEETRELEYNVLLGATILAHRLDDHL